MKPCTSAIYHPIVMKFGTQTDSGKRKSGGVPPFSKMATAIFRISEMLVFGNLTANFDEIWYTY
jgi:hypothetical protein